MAKILAIDDDPYFLISLNNFLTFQKYEVITVQNPYHAKEVIRDNEFDCLLMDVQMPGVDGFELIEYVRRVRPTLPVIIITGLSASKYGAEFSRYGRIAFLEKPFNPLTLMELIKKFTQPDLTE